MKPMTTFWNPQPAVFDGFGLSIAVRNEVILVGAPHDAYQGVESGRAFLFDRNGRLLREFSAPRRSGDDLFGMAVGLSEARVVIGSPGGRGRDGRNTGAVYLFDLKTGEHVRTLWSPEPHAGFFGHSVAVKDHWLVVGDPGASSAERFHTGAAFLFDGRTGALLQTLRPPDPPAGEPDRFGHAVTFVGNHVLVSAPLGGRDPPDAGVVYVFDGSTGAHLKTLRSPHGVSHEFFGWSVANSGDDGVIVGALGHAVATHVEVGMAYVFGVPSYDAIRQFDNPSAQSGDHFGEAVAMTSDLVFVGTPGKDAALADVGCVYVFNRQSGSLRETLWNPAPESGAADLFGYALSLDGNVLGVSAPYGGHKDGPDSGVVQAFFKSTLRPAASGGN